MTLTTILPCYSEEYGVVSQTITKLKKYFDSKNIEVNFVVSHNGFNKKFDFSNHPLSKLITYSHTTEPGLGRALKKGLALATGEYFFFTSPDNPFRLSDLNNMLPKLGSFDICVGSKLHPSSKYIAPRRRKIVSYLQWFITHLLLPKFPVRDPNGTLMGKTKLIQEIFKTCRSENFFLSTECIYKAFQKDLRVIEVPVVYEKKDKNTSVSLFKDSARSLAELMALRKSKANKTHV